MMQMHLLQGSLILLVVIVPLSVHGSLAVLHATTERDIIDTNVGSTENLLCGIPNEEEVRICLWTHSDFNNPDETLNLFEYFKGNDSKGNVDFPYFGKGLQNGDCGMTISKVEKVFSGYWNCTLISKRNQIFGASIQVKITEKCLKPNFKKTTLTSLNMNDKTGNITCCVNACQPPPKLELLLDVIKLDENANVLTETNEVSTCVIWLTPYLKWENHGQKLHCVVDQVNMTSNSSLIDTMTLDINYPPVFVDGKKTLVLPVLPYSEKTLNISIPFSGNPIPYVSWSVKKIGEKEAFSTLLNNGSKYSISTIFKADNVMVAELFIKEFKRQDLDYEYILNVTNEFGTEIHAVELREKFDVAYWGLFYIIIGGAVLVIIVVAIVVGVCVRKKKLCSRKKVRVTKAQAQRKPARVPKHSESSYEKAPTFDSIPEVDEQNDVSEITNTSSSVVTRV